ncbi:MAG: cadherin repeat domain-containing protein [Eubacteriales bacterium]
MVKQIKKRAFAILMTLALVVSIIPVLTIPARAGVAQTINCTNGVEKRVNAQTIFTTDLTDSEYVIGFTFSGINPGLYFEGYTKPVESTSNGTLPSYLVSYDSSNIGDLIFTSTTNEDIVVTVRIVDFDKGSNDSDETTTLTFRTASANAAPTDISLSSSSINENVISNTTVGTLSSTDPDTSNTFTYSLVDGEGSTDNASFSISGSSLRITNSPNYETKSSYSIRVRTTDQGGLYFEKVFTITINDRNETPTDINLSPSSVDENSPSNTVVGTLTTTDPDSGNTFTYTPVAGSGSTDNASFNIDGSSLCMTNSSDYEKKSSYSVRIRTTD